MILRSNQLKEHFSKGKLLPLYILSGDEPLLMQESEDQIRSACRDNGITERDRFNVEAGFDWNNLLQAGNSMSLFGDRKLLEVRHNKAKFDDKAKKALQEYCRDPNPDNVLLLITQKLDKSTQSTKWFKSIMDTGALIQIWPVSLEQFPQWVGHRMRFFGLEPSEEAISLLAQQVEGNLLAGAQEIDKLLLLHGTGPINAEQIEQAVGDHAQYSLFELVDTTLQGNLVQAVRMLNMLRSAGSEPAVVLWAFTRDIRNLSIIHRRLKDGMAQSRAFQETRVFSSRQNLYQTALKRIPPRALQHCLLECNRIDRAIKGAGGNPWDGFNTLIHWLCGSLQPGKLPLDL